MATVWAYRVGAFSQNAASGWSHTINFSSLSDLVSQLREANLYGAVQRMAIVAHGDHPGQVITDFAPRDPMSQATSVPGLRGLGVYLSRGAMLVFVSCIAGAGDAGSQFLKSVSQQLPGCVVVGFSVWGVADSSLGSMMNPGQVQCAPNQSPLPGCRLTPWCAYAKWACGETIYRLPSDEQKNNPGRRCANPRCPGHAHEQDRCPCTTWVTDPIVLRYRP